MKVPAIGLVTLAVAAQADRHNFGGKYYADLGLFGDSTKVCAPAGLLTVTQDGDKVSVKGTWDPFSKACKDYEMAGQKIDKSEGKVNDNDLTFEFKSKNDTAIDIKLAYAADKTSLLFSTAGQMAGEGDVKTKSDDDIKKWKKLVGKYSFKITEGDDKICCVPDSMEVDDQGTGLLHADGKWSKSEACKTHKLEDAKIEKQGLSIMKDLGVMWTTGQPNGIAAVGPADEKKPEELFFSYQPNDQKCKVTVSISGSKWWIWLIVGIVAAVIVAGVAFFFYNKKKNANKQHTPLMNA
jgi:hypothetical protein